MIWLNLVFLNTFFYWKIANSNLVKQKKEGMLFIKELIDLIYNRDLVLDLFANLKSKSLIRESKIVMQIIKTMEAKMNPKMLVKIQKLCFTKYKHCIVNRFED